MTADRFESAAEPAAGAAELDGFIDGKIRRIHGRRVAELLHELLRRRTEETASAIEGLRLQYPGYAEEIERVHPPYVVAAGRARIRTLFADGLISRELHGDLRDRLDAARKPSWTTRPGWISRCSGRSSCGVSGVRDMPPQPQSASPAR